MDAFIKGLLAGIPIAISFGPGFLLLFQASINHGHRTGLYILSGIVTGDFLLILLGYVGLGRFITGLGGIYTGLAAAAILFSFGIAALLKKHDPHQLDVEKNGEMRRLSHSGAFFKGLLINLTNPINFLFWMGVIALAASSFGAGSKRFYAFFAGLALMTVGADVLKIFLSGVLRKVLKPRVLLWINKIIGALFLIAGCYILIRVL